MSSRGLFHAIVSRGFALTAALEVGACASGQPPPHREGPPPPPRPVACSPACELTGRLTDADGKPVANTKVEYAGATATTGEDGTFTLVMTEYAPWAALQVYAGGRQLTLPVDRMGPGKHAQDFVLPAPDAP